MNTTIEAARENIDLLVDRTGNAVGVATDRAEQRVVSAADDVASRARDAGTYLRAKVLSATSGIHKGLDDSVLAIDRGYVRARSEASRAATAVTDFVSENPRTTMVIVASVGFALGILAHRNRMRA